MHAIVLLCLLAVAGAFVPMARPAFKLRVFDGVEIEPERMEAGEPDEELLEAPKTGDGLFNMNRRVRLGRSRDQDGKSNIWSIGKFFCHPFGNLISNFYLSAEPKMEVEDSEENGANTNLVVGGAVVATALACLPLFSLFSQLFPDPSDF